MHRVFRRAMATFTYDMCTGKLPWFLSFYSKTVVSEWELSEDEAMSGYCDDLWEYAVQEVDDRFLDRRKAHDIRLKLFRFWRKLRNWRYEQNALVHNHLESHGGALTYFIFFVFFTIGYNILQHFAFFHIL